MSQADPRSDLCAQCSEEGKRRRCAACRATPGGLSPLEWCGFLNEHLRRTRDSRRLTVRAAGRKVIVETAAPETTWVKRSNLTRAEAYAFFVGFMQGRDPNFLF